MTGVSKHMLFSHCEGFILGEIGSPTQFLDQSHALSSASGYSKVINETLRENDSMLTSRTSQKSDMPLKTDILEL